jgi:pentatricopeptide repeat protein
LADDGDLAGAEKVIAQMQNAGMRLCRSTLNIMIRACATLGDALGAERWMAELCMHGMEPTSSSYCGVILAWAKAGRFDMVEKWICRLSEAGISPPKKICRPVVRILISSAPDGYANIPIADMASAWLCRIHSQGASLDRRTINLMMSIYARAGEIVKTEAWARFMRDTQIAPNHTTMSALVTASRTAGDERRASAWLEYMEERGFTPGDLDANDNDSGTEEEGSLDQDDVTPAKRRTRGCKGNEVRQAGAVATSNGSLSGMPKNPQEPSSLQGTQLRPSPLSAIICYHGVPC